MDTAVPLILLRHGLIGLGSVATGKGIADEATVQSVITALMTIATVAWGLWSDRRVSKIDQVAAMRGVNTILADLDTANATKATNVINRR